MLSPSQDTRGRAVNETKFCIHRAHTSVGETDSKLILKIEYIVCLMVTKYGEKNNVKQKEWELQRAEINVCVEATILCRLDREGLNDRMASKQQQEESKEVSNGVIWCKSVSGTRNSRGTGSEAEACLMYSNKRPGWLGQSWRGTGYLRGKANREQDWSHGASRIVKSPAFTLNKIQNYYFGQRSDIL